MTCNDRATEIETQPQTGSCPVLNLDAFDLIKALPYCLLFLWGQARPVILYRNSNRSFLLCKPQFHQPLPRRVFQGIAQVIVHHLPNPVGIGDDGNTLLWRPVDYYAALRGKILDIGDGTTHDLYEIDRHHSHFQSISLDT